jgi:hypothetical protein
LVFYSMDKTELRMINYWPNKPNFKNRDNSNDIIYIYIYIWNFSCRSFFQVSVVGCSTPKFIEKQKILPTLKEMRAANSVEESSNPDSKSAKKEFPRAKAPSFDISFCMAILDALAVAPL